MRFRNHFGRYLVLTLMCLLATSSGSLIGKASAQQAGPDSGTTVYVEYLGDVDKPILPIVIFASMPSVVDMERVLGEIQAMEARREQVSDLDLGTIVGSLKLLLEIAGEDDSAGAFGSFRVTIVEPGEETTGVVGEKEAPRLLRMLGDVGGGRYEDLAGWVSTVQRRLEFGARS